jgi:CRISPR/Cas system endoribonuclease Cas6 (RAMP superfamily)
MGATSTAKTSIDMVMAKLEAVGINFLALDFDQTILDTHTGGRWTGSSDELVSHVRPLFTTLIQSAQAHHLQVAVVTFTGQVHLVKAVLESMVGPQAAERIPIRGNDRSWQYVGGGSMNGKQAHMASAVEELIHYQPGLKISKATTLLIDDDPKNIRHALNDGTRAIWFNPQNPNKLYSDIVNHLE